MVVRDDLIRALNVRFAQVGHNLKFDIVEDGVREDGPWWYVPVLATRNGHDVPREVTVNIFANIEDEFEQTEGVSILFIPVVNEAAA